MSITNNNEKKMEKFLEKHLVAYKNASTKAEQEKESIIVEAIYREERSNALNECKDPNKSMGFNYFIENYRNHEECLEFFARRMAFEVLIEREDVESKIHSEYPSAYKFLNANPNEYLIEIIKKHDKELGEFVESNLAVTTDLNAIQEFADSVCRNWAIFEMENGFFTNLIAQLTEYYDENCKGCNLTANEIIAYIFNAHNILERCRQISTTKEEMEAIREKMYAVEQIKEWLTNMAAMDSTVVNALEHGFYVGNKKYMLTKKNN